MPRSNWVRKLLFTFSLRSPFNLVNYLCISSYCRHGERNPEPSQSFNEPKIEVLETVLNPLIKNRSTGVSSLVDIEFPWKSPYLKKEYGQQVPEGDKQIYNIGRRFAKRFPEILNGRFSIADFNFTSSCFLRASQSATAFGLGYLEGKGHVTKLGFQPIPLTTYDCNNDKLHLQQRNCKRWRETVGKNPVSFSEHNKFIETDRFQKIVRKVREKLGLKGVKEVEEQLVRSMFTACAWGVQKFGYSEDSGWCSLFNREDQKVFDYSVDAYVYYRLGPGNQINLDVSCAQLQDIFTNIKSMAEKISGGPKKKVIARFGHTGTVLAPVLKLGLFIDRIPIQANNYEQIRNRKFILGKIVPMSGNIVFVLYRCHYGRYEIQFYHNERLVKLPACHSKVRCSLDQFLNYYKPMLDLCDYDQACKM